MNARLALLMLIWPFGCSNAVRDFGSGTPSGGAAGSGALGSSGTAGFSPAGNAGSDSAGSSGAGLGAAGDGAAGDGAAGDGAAGDGAAGDGAAGGSLKLLSVTPEGTAATTRSSISVTFSQPVTRESVSSAVIVTDERGPVAGEFSVAGAVATFQPRGSLCFARTYQVAVATGVSTPAGLHLARAESYPFAIPDGEWGDRQTVRANRTNLGGPVAAIDRDGNALLAWTETLSNTLNVNYYDARVSAWNGAQEPPLIASNGAPGPPLVGLANGHALAVYPGYGAAERTKNGVWSVTDSADLLGSVGNFATPSLAVAANGTALLAWNDRYGSIGANAFTPSTDPAKAGFWVKPTASAVSGWGTQQYVHALPDGSFMMLFSAHPGPSQLASNLSAQRLMPGGGWSVEHKIAAGDQYFQTAQDNFGNLLIVGEGGTPVARYSYAADSWTFTADVPSSACASLALAGDGTGFCVYYEDTASSGARLLLRTLTGKAWSSPVELRNATLNLSLSTILADDCGNAVVIWSEGTPTVLYARRYTPVGGWAPALTLADVAFTGRAAISGRGEIVSVFGGIGMSEDTNNVDTIRFE